MSPHAPTAGTSMASVPAEQWMKTAADILSMELRPFAKCQVSREGDAIHMVFNGVVDCAPVEISSFAAALLGKPGDAYYVAHEVVPAKSDEPPATTIKIPLKPGDVDITQTLAARVNQVCRESAKRQEESAAAACEQMEAALACAQQNRDDRATQLSGLLDALPLTEVAVGSVVQGQEPGVVIK